MTLRGFHGFVLLSRRAQTELADNLAEAGGVARVVGGKDATEECYWRARIVRAKVEADAAIRFSLATAFRVSVCVPDFRWSAISWRSRWISLMLSFMLLFARSGRLTAGYL